MSLDVYLTVDEPVKREKTSGIFIREKGKTIEISEEEWRKRNPDREPVRVTNQSEETDEVFSANITHNLTKMAAEAGVYEALWRPDEIGITKAKQLIPLLQDGMDLLCENPEKYQAFNPDNGWGSYEGLINFIGDYLEACQKWPNATVEVSR